MSDLVVGQIGPEAKYSVKFEGGKLIAEVGYDGAQFDAGVVLKLEAEAVVNALIDKLEQAVPGDQTAIASMLKMAVKATAG